MAIRLHPASTDWAGVVAAGQIAGLYYRPVIVYIRLKSCVRPVLVLARVQA